jgi:plastocyanin
MGEQLHMNRARRVALGLATLVALAGPRAAAAPEPGALAGVARVGGKATADVVVWLEAPSAPRPRERRFVVHQRNMQFVPRVLAAPVGATVELPNNDRVFHNVFSFTNGKPFDLGLYPTGASKHITLDRPAVNRLYCNIHPHMGAYIVAVDTPYYATSDRDGGFAMRDVPAGRYTYRAWRSGADAVTGVVTVGEGQPLEISWR